MRRVAAVFHFPVFVSIFFSLTFFFFYLSLQAVNAIDAVFAGELGHAADGLVGGRTAGGAGGEVHLAFCVLVH